MATQPLTGTPPGVEPLAGQIIRTFSIQRIEGQPIETRPPEKADDGPVFPGQTRAPYHASKGYATTVLTDKLDNPWAIAFLPDGKILVTEKPGRMRTLDKQGVISAPIAGVPAVVAVAEAGLLDLALDPNFAKNRRLFFSYNEPVGADGNTMAVASAVLSADDAALTDVKVIFESKPILPRAMPNNLGGRIAIARDGTLFLAVGDRSKSPPWDAAQKLDTTLGKIVHFTADGKPAPGNPFIGKTGAMPEIWSSGQRSQEGLAFAPNGQLWETENGPRGGDELNKIEPGKNYGWPVAVHGIDYTTKPITGGVIDAPGTEQPRYYWDPVIAPSGLAFYSGNLFPQWKNSVFVGALRGKMIDRLTLDGDKVVSEEPLLTEQNMRFRDVRMGPEGAVYVLSESGVLLKLTPQ